MVYMFFYRRRSCDDPGLGLLKDNPNRPNVKMITYSNQKYRGLWQLGKQYWLGQSFNWQWERRILKHFFIKLVHWIVKINNNGKRSKDITPKVGWPYFGNTDKVVALYLWLVSVFKNSIQRLGIGSWRWGGSTEHELDKPKWTAKQCLLLSQVTIISAQQLGNSSKRMAVWTGSAVLSQWLQMI